MHAQYINTIRSSSRLVVRHMSFAIVTWVNIRDARINAIKFSMSILNIGHLNSLCKIFVNILVHSCNILCFLLPYNHATTEINMKRSAHKFSVGFLQNLAKKFLIQSIICIEYLAIIYIQELPKLHSINSFGN